MKKDKNQKSISDVVKNSHIKNWIYDVISGVVLTEKTAILSEKYNKYVFKVSKCATKKSVKEAVAAIWNVKIKAVNLLNVKGKAKVFKGCKGKRSDYKKAIVTTLTPIAVINDKVVS